MKNFSLLFLFIIVACSSTPKLESRSDGEKLKAIISEYTEATKRLDAFEAPYYNVEENFDKFGDYLSPEFFARDKANLHQALEQLKTVDRARLDASDKVAYELFQSNVEKFLQGYQYPFELLEFNQMGNRVRSFIDSANPALTDFPFDSVKHYEAFLKRAKGFGPYVDRLMATFRRGIDQKITLSCEIARSTVKSYAEGLESNPDKNPFVKPIEKMPETFSTADRQRLKRDYRKMVSEDILPHLQRFDKFFRKEYTPHCRKEFGIGALPMGKSWYSYSIRANTDLNVDAQTVHRLGLNEVARIEQEMSEIQKKLGYSGPLKTFLLKIVKDPNSYFKTREELIGSFSKAKLDVDKKIPQYFSLMPKGDFRIAETSNPEEAAGSYHGPTETNPIGRFVVNSTNLHSVPKFGVATLLLHEAVPGHHFQIALQFEQKEKLSEFQRKIYSSTAFVEGWALYSEYLGREMGIFDDYQRLGNLADEMLRAVRLVVDTGIHSMGWSQKRTLAYMREHLASHERENEIEANRYSVWPGQALAYKMGQLKIIELRQLAEKELGNKFDIREFHKVVIGSGTVSLNVLEEKVNDWIHGSKI